MPKTRTKPRQRATEMFSPSALKEAISVLPALPDTESPDEVRAFLRNRLHFNSERTRRDYAGYVVQRMFPSGRADWALRAFVKEYQGRQELRDACFYRFCKSEVLMREVVLELLVPAIGTGKTTRHSIQNYLEARFGTHQRYAPKCTQAIVETLGASGIANISKSVISYGYRDILLPSFAFVLHSEFPEPGMYDVGKLENNQVVRAMLWNPDRVVPALYELRNLGIITKVSDIDKIRQFTTKWKLDGVVEHLAGRGVRT